MQIRPIIFLILIPCLALTLIDGNSKTNTPYSEKATGIYLDSLENEILIVSQKGKPLYYKSYIFTPVCNTGECLPIFINLNWDLKGKYSGFSQPDGEILTKLDHVPFSIEDYKLLDEILHGQDPRYQDISKHSDNRNDAQHGSPSVSMNTKTFMTKYEMVDGITGSTLPEQKDKFVPGALYTTYTLWDLANVHERKMVNYTRDSLMDEHIEYLLLQPELGCQDFVINELAARSIDKNSRLNIMMGIIDTAESNINHVILDRISYYDLNFDTVYNTLNRKYFSMDNNPDILTKQRILYLWRYGRMEDEIFTKLANELAESIELFDDILNVFINHPLWPNGIVDILIEQIDLLENRDKQTKLYNILVDNKENLNDEDWLSIKRIKKKYKF